MTSEVLMLLNLILIPQPQVVRAGEGVLRPAKGFCIVLSADASDEDRFAADCLAQCLKRDLELDVSVGAEPAAGVVPIHLLRKPGLPAQGYELIVTPGDATLQASDAPGLYYATQTLRQCFRRDEAGLNLPAMTIHDWPDLTYRAIHYDTKHHQDRREFVEWLIVELAGHKINVLVWEWEDKFAYPRRPEIGAPGAFTLAEMQELTRFAAAHHVQIVPLVQGLGHVSYILKHPQYRDLREVPDSNWEFCPLREGTYKLLFDLWDQAIEATPGSQFLHIGSDEAYELGTGEDCGCKAKVGEIGKDALMQVFIRRAVEHVQSRGREVISWGGGWRAGSVQTPPEGMIYAVSSSPEYLARAKAAGFPGWLFAPNPGIEPLWLPYFPFVPSTLWRDDPADQARIRRGCFRDTSESIAAAVQLKAIEGSITTSWDDSGLHVLCWMPRFLCAAEFSWKAEGRDLDTWLRRYFTSYFGPESCDLRDLFQLAQDASLFYYDTFQRKVWHWGDVGKMHLPDLPRGDLEYSGFFRQRYNDLLIETRKQRQSVHRAIAIVEDNLAGPVLHRYDLEIMRAHLALCRHNVNLILMLADLEEQIALASGRHFDDRAAALGHLRKAQSLVEENLAERKAVFEELVAVYEQTRLPKGLSLPGKPYLHARDRARHFANRTADMSFLIYDEQLLGLEDWLTRLKTIIADYEAKLGR